MKQVLSNTKRQVKEFIKDKLLTHKTAQMERIMAIQERIPSRQQFYHVRDMSKCHNCRSGANIAQTFEYVSR